MDIKLNDMLNDVQLSDKSFNLLNPEGYYRLKIPDEQRHYYKNKGYIRGYSNSDIGNYKMATIKNYYTSSAIPLHQDDIINVLLPKTFVKRTTKQFMTDYNINDYRILVLIAGSDYLFDDNGNFDSSINRLNISWYNKTGTLLTNRVSEITLPVIYKGEQFINLEFYNMYFNMGDYYKDFKYIYLTDWLPKDYPQSHYIDEQNRIYNCGILRKGEDPYGNWQEQQNNLAFKHYLYQSHIRKEK